MKLGQLYRDNRRQEAQGGAVYSIDYRRVLGAEAPLIDAAIRGTLGADDRVDPHVMKMVMAVFAYAAAVGTAEDTRVPIEPPVRIVEIS